MKKMYLPIVLLTLFFCSTARAQGDPEAMKKWMDYMTPGDMQRELAKSEGEWNTEITMWVAPGAPPVTTKGTCVNKMILGGRYLESKHTATVMNMPFEGVGTYGFDNAKKVFIISWLDNMGTGIMQLEGAWDDATSSVVFTGKELDPMTGQDMEVREVHKIVDSNNQVMEMFSKQNGQETKTMEVKYTRK